MTILVIGGSGHVGSLVLPGLAQRHDVRVLDPRPPAGPHDHVPGTADDPAALDRALKGVDAVVHAALAPAHEDGPAAAARSFEVNVTSVHLTLQAAHRAGVRHAVLFSSLSVFRDLADRPLDETVPPDATDLYGLTKRLAEQVCRAATEEWDMTATVLRLAWPTTDEAWPDWSLPGVAQSARRTADGTMIPALAATDLTRAVLAALDHRHGYEVFHITGDDSGRHWNQTKARDLLGWRPVRQ
ncbi:NAD(P)-dependent oxidoreductase [Streptomyces bambusae]|uniref:NAD-dependent epimerase/dehydratase family protein n=1 Tax=Streptomyces bambusae TaxID=1550616 RepID=UPI001CFCE3E8|nr:NAD(P)-dependent oxidoreductase [Streptomyces bambusae]MCB5167711.1 NAD(P)-dependent oxidoreductase [Streptomyces bambusae]